MANRRMFSLGVVDSDAFLDLPLRIQALYFHLGMRADDDGFIDNMKRILRFTGQTQSDLDTLVRNGYVISFRSGVSVITHWRENNRIQKDRYKPTAYARERGMLDVDDSGRYVVREEFLEFVSCPDVPCTGYRLDTDCIQDGSNVCPEDEGKQTHDGKDVFETLPLLKGGKAVVTEEYVKRLEGLYPAVDVRAEIRKAVAWLEANPRNRKSQWRRFLNSWLSRCQDSAPRVDETKPAARLKALETVHQDRIPSGRYDDVDVMDFSDPDFDFSAYCERNGIVTEDPDD